MTDIFMEISAVVVCTAGLAWFAALCRQPIIVAYLLSGIMVGPWGLGFMGASEPFDAISHMGVTLVLFLAGMVLHPNRLKRLLRSHHESDQ